MFRLANLLGCIYANLANFLRVHLDEMALKLLTPGGMKLPKNPTHSVRFTSEEVTTTKYRSLTPPSSSVINFSGPHSYPTGNNSGNSAPSSPENQEFPVQAATDRLNINEQRIKLLTAINQIVQQRADLEKNRDSLSNLLGDLKKKLKRRIEDCHFEKREKLKSLKHANQKLEKERFSILSEIEHLKRHLEKEEAHHVQHARLAVAQAIQGVAKGSASSSDLFLPCSVSNLPSLVSRSVAKNAPSRVADNKLAAARLMRDIAELRQRVGHVEARLAHEMKRKRQAEQDIVRLRKELSATKSNIASLRLPPPSLRKNCHKFV